MAYNCLICGDSLLGQESYDLGDGIILCEDCYKLVLEQEKKIKELESRKSSKGGPIEKERF